MKSLFGVLGATFLLVACGDSSVAPIPGKPDPTLSNLGSMNVGDVRVMTFSDASGGLSIPASLQSAQFAVILGNSNVTTGSIASYNVHGDWLSPSTQSPVADLFPPSQQPFMSPVMLSRGEAFEAQLRNFERTRLPRPGGRATSAARGAAADKLTPLPSGATNPPPAVGSTISFKVLTSAGFDGVTTSACSSSGFSTTVGVVKYVSLQARVVSDVKSPAGGFTDA
ncbi:MAG TPA: hypothetical protein VIG47_15960, partial [Gemmatimonadaceae bacterium]